MYLQSIWLSDVKHGEKLAMVNEFFQAEYARRYGDSKKSGLYQEDDWSRIAFCHSKVSEIGGSVLDVGVGPGGLLNVLHLDPCFDRVTGIDIRHYSKLVKLSEDLDIRIMDIGSASFPDNSFDTVVCMEVLEHLDKERFHSALAELRRMAKKSIFVTVPFREPEPLPSYHKQRFDYKDIERCFPTAEFFLLKRRRGIAWIAAIEMLDAEKDAEREAGVGSNKTEESVECEILSLDKIAEDEAEQAKEYWSGAKIDFYTRQKEWSDYIAKKVLAFAPASVFEFGCSAGKNLLAILAHSSDVSVSGVDINPSAVEFARSRALNVFHGDESALKKSEDGAVDVSFTVSVLDHLPKPEPVLADLARQSRVAILLFEPWLGRQGRVLRNIDRRSGELVDTTPFSYSWDYESMVSRVLPDWHVEIEDYPIDSNLGAFYRLYTLTRNPRLLREECKDHCSSRPRKEVNARDLFREKEHIPPRVFDGIDAFVERRLHRDFRRWSKAIEKKRKAMKASDRKLVGIAPKGGYRPGQEVEFKQTGQRGLCEVVRASKRPVWCRLIYTLVRELDPRTLLELGTCVGISGSYILAAMKNTGVFYTLEGATDFSLVAEETISALKLDRKARFVRGLFDQTLQQTLDKEKKWDFVFIDGHHDGCATIRYFERIRPYLSETALVLIDDIRWSSDMTRAWNAITAREDVALCVDFKEVGLCGIFPTEERWYVEADVTDARN